MDELNKNKKLRSFMFSFLIISVLFHTIEPTREYMKLITPLLLAVFSLILVLKFKATKSIKLRNWLLVVSSSLFLHELLFSSSLIFEDFHYGDSLGFTLLGIPVFILFNWLIVILGGYQIAKRFTSQSLWISLFAGVFTLVFSIVLEPIALELNYWNWSHESAPLIHYLKWFIVAFVVTHSYQHTKVDINSRFPRYVAATVFFMFLILNVIFSIA